MAFKDSHRLTGKLSNEKQGLLFLPRGRQVSIWSFSFLKLHLKTDTKEIQKRGEGGNLPAS